MSTKKNYVLDTSVYLTEASSIFEFGRNDIFVPLKVLEEIDGHTEKAIISKVIPQLPLQDAHTLMETMGATNYGLDTKVRFVCNYCDHNEIMELPITADFFTGK